MPLIGMLHFLIAVGFAVHAMRTGRPQYWLFILLFVPLAGSVAYVLIELLPELARTRRARQVTGSIGDIVNPDREWRRRLEHASINNSVSAKLALAEEAERKGMWLEAVALYEASATGIYATEPPVLVALARAYLGAGNAKAALSTLDRLQAAHPKIENAEGHLLYARALEAEGRTGEAEHELVSLLGYHNGIEAKARLAMLLLKRGEPKKARVLFEEIVRSSDARMLPLTDAEGDWIKVAKANL